jgi:hypothetical protein
MIDSNSGDESSNDSPTAVSVRKLPPNKKHRGAHGELTACVYLLGEGYEVFRNVSAWGTADLIAIRGGEFLRVDVKSGCPSTRNPTSVQQQEGVVILHVNEQGFCEFDADRKRRGMRNKFIQ